MRILVTGSRFFSDYPTFTRGITVALETLIAKNPDDKNIVLVHGGAKGADAMCDIFVSHTSSYLHGRGYTITTDPVKVTEDEWKQYGKFAGPQRNTRMVVKGADICVAFFKTGALNKGTKDCSSKAKIAGIEVLEFWGK